MNTHRADDHLRAPPQQLRVRSTDMFTRRAALGSVVASLVLAGCGNSDEPTSTKSGEPGRRSVEPAEFAMLTKKASTYVLNVHTPDEGSIPGTDAAIPYDELERRSQELPERSTALAIYCRTGRMSSEAVPTLRRLGFTTITELAGGMEAWQADGRELLTDTGGTS